MCASLGSSAIPLIFKITFTTGKVSITYQVNSSYLGQIDTTWAPSTSFKIELLLLSGYYQVCLFIFNPFRRH